MFLRPDEVTNLKRGRQIQLEIKEGDVRVLKRNFCGVYELYCQQNPRDVEYFEDLVLFKNRYGTAKKKFPLYNLTRQSMDVYPIAERVDPRELLKWFGEYGKIIYKKTSSIDDMEIEYYEWISDMENTMSSFQIIKYRNKYTLNIALKKKSERIKKAS